MHSQRTGGVTEAEAISALPHVAAQTSSASVYNANFSARTHGCAYNGERKCMAHRHVSSFFSRPAFRPRLNPYVSCCGLGPCVCTQGATRAQHEHSGGPAGPESKWPEERAWKLEMLTAKTSR